MGAGPGWRSVNVFAGAVMLLTVPWGYLHLHETPSFARLTSRVTPSLTAMWTVQHRRNLLLCSFLWLYPCGKPEHHHVFGKSDAVADLSLSAAVAEQYLGLAALVTIPMSGFVGPLLNRVGKRRGALIVYGLWTLGILGSYLYLPAGPLLRLALACLTSGASGGLIIATAFTTELFPTAQRGDAMAWSNSLLGRIGFIASPPLMSMLADAQGWTNTMPYLAVLPLSALVVVWLVPNRRPLRETTMHRNGAATEPSRIPGIADTIEVLWTILDQEMQARLGSPSVPTASREYERHCEWQPHGVVALPHAEELVKRLLAYQERTGKVALIVDGRGACPTERRSSQLLRAAVNRGLNYMPIVVYGASLLAKVTQTLALRAGRSSISSILNCAMSRPDKRQLPTSRSV